MYYAAARATIEAQLWQLVSVLASGLQRLESLDSYEGVPTRVRGRDGISRPWRDEIT